MAKFFCSVLVLAIALFSVGQAEDHKIVKFRGFTITLGSPWDHDQVKEVLKTKGVRFDKIDLAVKVAQKALPGARLHLVAGRNTRSHEGCLIEMLETIDANVILRKDCFSVRTVDELIKGLVHLNTLILERAAAWLE